MRGTVYLAAISVVTLLSLMVVSCAPTAPSTTAPVTTTSATAAPTTSTKPVTQPAADAPRYGGKLTLSTPRDIVDFDEVAGWQAGAYTLQMTNLDLLTGNWAKGQAGSGEYPFLDNGVYARQAANLAESWEMPEVGHWIVHLRKGVRYALNAQSEASRLVNGREFNANDAEAALNSYLHTATAYINKTFPGLAKEASVKALDKYTLEIKVPTSMSLDAADMFFTFSSVDVPVEVIQKYGSQKDWRNSVGTGPFILTDFVPGSAATLVKSPTFWMKDPVGPGKGNQLPYVDGVKILIIPDDSTRLAAFRTAKTDMRGFTTWDFVSREDADVIRKGLPEIKYRKGLAGDSPLGMRTDKPPFNDIRVRQALIMATDYDQIIQKLNGGEGNKLGFPESLNSGYEDLYLSINDASAAIKALYSYNPDKAKRLLADAGYPDGFKTTVTCQNASTPIDRASILKDMWAKVGIELTIKPLEVAAHASIARSRNYEGLIQDVGMGGGNVMLRGNRLMGSGQTNMSWVDDPKIVAAYAKIGSIALTDWNQAGTLHKELMQYAIEQAWGIPFPTAGGSVMWWPWLKNFFGDSSVGYFNYGNFAQYAWVDQNLKESMGH